MRRVALTALLFFTACVAHEKSGDVAVAAGDWRGAFYHYGVALEGEPNNLPLRDKLQHARTEALNQATQRAQTCAGAGDWACALDQSEFVVSVDGGNREMAQLRMTAAKAVGLSWVQAGRNEGARANFRRAFELIGKGTATSNDPEVASSAQSARTEVLGRLDTEVERLRAQSSFPAAIELLDLAVSVDAGHRGKLDAVRQEQAAFVEAQYEERARAGDAALTGHRWAEAAAAYRAALGLHPGGRAEALFRYASSVDAAEQALARQDFRSAANSYRQAAALGVDPEGYAVTMLQRVEVRPYQVRLRSILVYALRPSGMPWAGRRDPALQPLLRALSRSTLPAGGSVPEAAIAQARTIPLEFAPTLQVEAMVPDRGPLVSAPVRGFYALYDASFVVLTNSFDTRALQLRVQHIGDGPEEAGQVSIALRDLVGAGRMVLSDRAVARLELIAEPANSLPPDALIGWSPPVAAPPAVAEPSPPAGGGPGFHLRLADVAVRVTREDCPRPYRAPPSPAVEVEQEGQIIFRSQADRVHEAQWSPPGVRIRRAGRLRVRLLELGSGRPVVLLETWVPPEALASGTFEAQSPGGSWVRLRFSGPERVGSAY